MVDGNGRDGNLSYLTCSFIFLARSAVVCQSATLSLLAQDLSQDGHREKGGPGSVRILVKLICASQYQPTIRIRTWGRELHVCRCAFKNAPHDLSNSSRSDYREERLFTLRNEPRQCICDNIERMGRTLQAPPPNSNSINGAASAACFEISAIVQRRALWLTIN